ncbi:MAG: hypothetical protein ABI700_27115, partial [Chloroflexota bacterium]
EAIQQSQTETERMGDLLSLARIFFIRSLIHLNRHDLKDALSYNARAIEFFELLNKPRNIFEALLYGGDIYEMQGDTRRACAMWTRAIEIVQTRVPGFQRRLGELNVRLSRYRPAKTD